MIIRWCLLWGTGNVRKYCIARNCALCAAFSLWMVRIGHPRWRFWVARCTVEVITPSKRSAWYQLQHVNERSMEWMGTTGTGIVCWLCFQIHASLRCGGVKWVWEIYLYRNFARNQEGMRVIWWERIREGVSITVTWQGRNPMNFHSFRTVCL